MNLRLSLIGLLLVVALSACGGAAGGSSTILYLSAAAGGTPQLFRRTLGEDTPRQITGVGDPAAPEVIDYAVAPGGERILYATIDAAGGSTLRVVDVDGGEAAVLLDCPAAECSGIAWSPDGRRVVYERRPWEDGAYGTPRLYWLDPARGDTLPLVEGNATPSYGARFSPDGQWLSYVSPADEGVVAYRLSDGQQRLFGSRAGSPAAWSPDSASLVYGDMVAQGHMTAPDTPAGAPIQESSNVFLYRKGVDGEEDRQRLSPDAAVADSVPAFSPDGTWIAFGRTPANTAAGRQLWLMRADGSEARALTADPAVTYGPPGWSADGRSLLYQRYELNDPAAAPSVWRLDVASGEVTLLARDAWRPSWLP